MEVSMLGLRTPRRGTARGAASPMAKLRSAERERRLDFDFEHEDEGDFAEDIPKFYLHDLLYRKVDPKSALANLFFLPDLSTYANKFELLCKSFEHSLTSGNCLEVPQFRQNENSVKNPNEK